MNRSPIASIKFPSLKDKIKIYQDESDKINKGQMRTIRNQKLSFRTEMEKIIDDQTLRIGNNKASFTLDVNV